MPPLPHHRAYGSVPRRFGGLSIHPLLHGKQAQTTEAGVGEETLAPLNLLIDTIEADRYPYSPSIRRLQDQGSWLRAAQTPRGWHAHITVSDLPADQV